MVELTGGLVIGSSGKRNTDSFHCLLARENTSRMEAAGTTLLVPTFASGIGAHGGAQVLLRSCCLHSIGPRPLQGSASDRAMMGAIARVMDSGSRASLVRKSGGCMGVEATCL